MGTLEHILGIDQKEVYAALSGPVPVLLGLGFWGQWWHKHNCHVEGCWRLSWHPHPDHGHPVCRHHHPDGRNGMNRYFADVSNNNTQEMNFTAYRKVGQHVLIGHKATEATTFVDKYHAERSERSHKAGSWVLHYHFARANSSASAQARFFWSQIKGHMASPKDFACLDFEGESLMGVTLREAAQWINDFDREFRKISGHSLIGYCSESLLRELVKAGARIHGDRWWIAAYGMNKPSIGGIKTWAWQFTNGEIGPQPHQCVGIGHCDVSTLNWATYLRLRLTKPRV